MFNSKEENPSSRLATPPSPASFKALFPGFLCQGGLGWNTAPGDSCPHQQTASLNLINMSPLRLSSILSTLIKTIFLPSQGPWDSPSFFYNSSSLQLPNRKD